MRHTTITTSECESLGFALICPIQRTRTKASVIYRADARETITDFMKFGMLDVAYGKYATEIVNKAEYQDQIADVMTKVRKRLR